MLYLYRLRFIAKNNSLPTASVASIGDNKMDDITPPAMAKLRLVFVIDEHRVYSYKQSQQLTALRQH